LAEVDNPLNSWLYAYALPNGCLRPVSVLTAETSDDTDTQDFVVETDEDGNQVLYTNTADATLLFIKLITDTTKFSPLMVVALARLLSSYLAGPIIKGTEGMKVAQAQLGSFLKVEFPAAAAADSNARQSNAYENFTPGSIGARA
jgi:hypothetical protein